MNYVKLFGTFLVLLISNWGPGFRGTNACCFKVQAENERIFSLSKKYITVFIDFFMNRKTDVLCT